MGVASDYSKITLEDPALMHADNKSESIDEVCETSQVIQWLLCFAKYLWVLVLLPKTLQLPICLYFVIRARMACGAKLKFNHMALFLLFGSCVQAVAVLSQVLLGATDTARIYAAINTCCLWFIGVEIYALAVAEQWNDYEIRRFGKLLLFNFAVLSSLYLLSVVTNIKTISLMGMNYNLVGADYIEFAFGSGDLSQRFRGFMGTALAPSHLFLISMPICVVTYRKGLKRPLVCVCLCVITFVAIIETHSRSGVIFCFICLVTSIAYWAVTSKKYSKILKTAVMIAVCIAIMIVLFHFNDINTFLTNLMNSRAGSNRVRFQMYEASINKVLSESPLIGIGIKYLINSIPYGSHCTYIGLLYKSGILGTIFFTLGFIGLHRRLYKSCKRYDSGWLIYICCLAYFGFLLFADLDSSDWTITLAFLVWGALTAMRDCTVKEDCSTKIERNEL